MKQTPNTPSVAELETQLDDFDPEVRRNALELLKQEVEADRLDVPEPRPIVNMHAHTFFSYNARGYSPSRFAWEAYREGLEVAGIVDFDCVDGSQEFLEAGRLLGLKTVAGFESRVFVSEYSDRVINSPGEPGVYYLAGFGFLRPPAQGTRADEILSDMQQRAQERNRRMLAKINEHLDEAAIDYEEDVLPLTPAGNATERHMLDAYEQKARELNPDPDDLAAFWSDKLGEDQSTVRGLLDDLPALKGLIRSRLMKSGGVGYAQPDEGSFPPLEDVVEMTVECEAVPSGCWLDGTSEGEADPVRHFGFLRDKGIPTLTIIPDRNWDIDDPGERELKVRKLNEAVEAGKQLEMPILVGTEMNKHGQKFVDEFDSPALEPHRDTFLAGAHTAWGHTLLKSTAGVGYTDAWTREHFGDDAAARNEFFRRIGALPHPDEGTMQELSEAGPDAEPDDFRRTLEG